MEEKKKIIVVGYPKSGNTWMSRLTAELIGCPVKGFLYSNHNEIAIEGLNRISQFEVYKSHHQLHEIIEKDVEEAKIIYVIRDPRDISLSGRLYFYNIRNVFANIESVNLSLETILENQPFHQRIAMRAMRDKMNKAVLHGNAEIDHWCRVSWKEHLFPYFENPSFLKVKYESVLSNPILEIERILKFLNINRDLGQIQSAINNQSFQKVKKKFTDINEVEKAIFLRKGEKEQWKTNITQNENEIFVKEIGKELLLLGYHLI